MVSGRVQALLEQLRAQGIRDEQVLNALAAVPREKFIDEAFEHKAWENIALPIGQGQTIGTQDDDVSGLRRFAIVWPSAVRYPLWPAPELRFPAGRHR